METKSPSLILLLVGWGRGRLVIVGRLLNLPVIGAIIKGMDYGRMTLVFSSVRLCVSFIHECLSSARGSITGRFDAGN